MLDFDGFLLILFCIGSEDGETIVVSAKNFVWFKNDCDPQNQPGFIVEG